MAISINYVNFCVKLGLTITKNKKAHFFKDCFSLTIGVKGILLGNTSSTSIAQKMILNQPAITWTVNYNGLDIITDYFAQTINTVSYGKYLYHKKFLIKVKLLSKF